MIPLRQVLRVSRHDQHGWGMLSAASVVALAILGLQGRGALVVAADGRRGERLGALRAATRHAEPRTYTDLLDMSDDELARVDIALVNLCPQCLANWIGGPGGFKRKQIDTG